MKRAALIVALTLVPEVLGWAQRYETVDKTVRFTWVDVYVDSADAPLAAYQVEILSTRGDVKIVGIEGGLHPAFKEPPYYDPAALAQDRVILAAFSTGKDLPTGKTRVARVHVQVTGDVTPEYAAKFVAAATRQGERIEAGVSLAEGEKP